MMKFSARDRLKLLGGGAASMLLSGCGGGNSSPEPTPPVAGPTPPPPTNPPPVSGGNSPLPVGMLRDAYQNDFKIGCALSSNQIDNADFDATVGLAQFNSVTPSYQLKANEIAPTDGVFNFEPADRVVDWAIANNMDVRGHALVWHETTPAYFYEGTPNQIRTRLETYIQTVVEHFAGRIPVWDVVNEVVSVDLWSGANAVGPDRRSDWYNAVGSADYIDWAFQAARAADPNAQLFLNEYSTDHPVKQPWLLEIVQRLQDRNIPIDGIGHQMHMGLNDDPQVLLQAIDAVDNQFLGLINHITEIDVDFYNDPGSCWSAQVDCDPDLGPVAPVGMLATQAQLLRDFYTGLRQRSSVESVSTWGVTDNESWLNRLPVPRSNYPLLFDRQGEPKPALWAIADPDYVIPTE